MLHVDCASLRRRTTFLVFAKCLVFGAFAFAFGLRLGPIAAAIVVATTLVVTTGLVLLLRFRAGRWSRLSREGRVLCDGDPESRRTDERRATHRGCVWHHLVADTSVPPRLGCPHVRADSIASIEYGPWSRVWQDSVLIIRLIESESVGMRVFSRPIDLGGAFVPRRLSHHLLLGGAPRCAGVQANGPVTVVRSPSMWLPWQPALALSIPLAGVALAGRGWRDRRAVVACVFAHELALVLGLYALWRIAGRLSVMKVDHALDRGRTIWHLEQSLHLPSELALQQVALAHPLVVQAANLYYAVAHVPALIAMLLWAFIWHREPYARVRNVLALLTGVCLLVQLLPVAPPRLVPDLGFVDTAHFYGQSVYGAVGTGVSDQLSAMPSLHVGWAVLVAAAVVLLGTSPWRWLVVAHPVMTLLAVAVTANHWWLDGVAAGAILVASVALDALVHRSRGAPAGADAGLVINLDGDGRDEQPGVPVPRPRLLAVPAPDAGDEIRDGEKV